MVRVSERLRYDATNSRIEQAKNFADTAQEIAVSGRKLKMLSDDPAAAVRVFRNRTKLENIGQFRKSIDFASGFLGKSEDTLLSLNDVLIRARELAVQLANTTWSPSDRKITSEEIKQMIGHAISLGNTTYADRYVFGGFKTNMPPITPDGTYAGDDGIIIMQLDEDAFRPINIPGREVFDVEPDNENKEIPVIYTLKEFYKSLQDNDVSGIQKIIGRLDQSITRMVNCTASVGARRAAINNITERLDKGEEEYLKDNNNLEGADPIKAMLDLKRSETGLQFTLQSSAKVLQPTLLQFLQG